MPTHFVLVDFENVQPKNLGALSPADTHVRVFAGASQSKVDLGLAQALQRFGTHAEYIQIVGSGKDALDFHIAFYIGELSAKHPSAHFTIVSKDTGFDPLLKHLAARGVRCKRIASLAGGAPSKEAPAKAAAKKAAAPAPAKPVAFATELSRVQEARERLAGLKAARPRTVRTLSSSLKSWFKPTLSDAALSELLVELEKDGVITLDGSKVSYAP
jgi:hypothetical protein